MLFQILLAVASCAIATAQGFDSANYKDLKWTNVGPARGGRSVACTGVRTRPNEYYFGATGGGLWKSTDAGENWACVSDGFFRTSSVGAVAVSDSNPDIVWAGMGERDIRGDISEGDGVYRSTDAGKTWTHMGLENCRTISRIVIDPTEPNIVYVAALGHVYGAGPERGVYKTTDGGKNWNKVLFESDRAGAVELVMNPKDSKTLYAATWEAWRKPWFLNSGGAGSKLWKTTDAGAHWTDLTPMPGLPKDVVGKIGVTVSGADSKRLYAIIEAHDGGIFRSDDAGATWSKTTDDSQWRQRAWYYTHIYADPKNADKVYCLNVGAGRSSDGGKTWQRLGTPHSDNHDMWINPDDPQKMIEANDGGASVSTNGGTNWTAQDYPTAQFYHVTADNHVPYKIYGAQQDNSSIMLSQGDLDTPEKHNWQGTAGGESGFIAVKPDDPEIVYGGNYSGDLSVINYRTKLSKGIDPWPENPMGHGAEDIPHRIQWTWPIVFSPNDPDILYTASQYLMKTTNDGQSWDIISPDLTRNDRSKQKSSGGPITQDNTSIEYYDTIFSVAESPLRKGMIWVGTDDGLVQLTENGGKSWRNVTGKDFPDWGRVSMVEASPFDANTAYVAINNYQNDDTGVYIFRTHDAGRTWTRIVSGIGPDAFARVCRVDLRRPGLLYAGTEKGVYVSFDDGDHWQSLQQNLPIVPVHDLICKNDDLVIATHGRSFWIMRGMSKLADLTGGAIRAPMLYQPWNQQRIGGSARGELHYYLPGEAKSVEFSYFDSQGRALGSSKGETSPGYHSLTASFSAPGFGTFPGMIFWSGGSRPIPAPPGAVTVRMTVDGQAQTKTLTLTEDPRLPGSTKALQAQYETSLQINARANQANQAVLRIRDMKDQIDKAMADPKATAEIKASGSALKDKLTAIEGEIYQYRSRSGQDPLNYPIKLNDQLAGVLSNVQSGQIAPTKQALAVFDKLSKALQVQLNSLEALERTEVASYSSLLRRNGLTGITPKNPPLQQGGNRRGGFEEEEEEQGEG